MTTVRLRQLADHLAHRLSFVPALYVVGGVIVAFAGAQADSWLVETEVAPVLSTSAANARAVYTALAGGLITSITLLLSMALVAVQLASSQLSPRTLRDWLGDRSLQHTVGIALGTTVYSLISLQSVDSSDGPETPAVNVTVLLAIALGVMSLFAVVRAVDHIANSVRVDKVARSIMQRTIAMLDTQQDLGVGQRPGVVPALDTRSVMCEIDVAEQASPISATRPGWIQQIDHDALFKAMPETTTVWVVVAVGAFVPAELPLLYVSPRPDDATIAALREAVAIGASRTMQQDVGFGVLQLVDIAVRALSPGVNDPSTANDVIVHLGAIMLAIWGLPVSAPATTHEGRTLVSPVATHEQLLRQAFDPIRRAGRADPVVLASLVRTLRLLIDECERRSLAGPVEPVEELIAAVRSSADRSGWSVWEARDFDDVAGS